MAGKGSIKAIIATQYDATGLNKARKELGSFAKSLKGTLAGLGVATSFGALVGQLTEAAKAAVADTKAQALLANQMRNTVSANDSQIASTEAFIQKLQLQTSILDDQLRPAMSSLVRATGDVAKAQDLLTVATDVSAATGKDLESVALALGKAYSGQTTALFRMIPGLKGSSDWLAKLKANTQGAAEEAANTDPFTKMNVAFNDMQETVGMALIPTLQDIAGFITSAEFQNAWADATEQFSNFVAGGWWAVKETINIVSDMNNALSNLGLPLEKLKRDWEEVLWLAFPVQKLLGVIGAYSKSVANAPDETSRLVRRRLESLGAIGVSDVEVSNKQSGATKKLATENKALTEAVNKAKDAFEAKVKAYQDAVKAAQDIIDSTKEITKTFGELFKVTPEMGEFETKTVDAFNAIYDTIKTSLADGRILKTAADSITAYVDGAMATLQAYAKQRDIFESQMQAYKEAVAAGEAIIASTKEMTASFISLFKTAPQMGEFESKTVNAFENIFNTIKSALADKRILQDSANALSSYATSTMNSLKAIAKQQDVLAGKINVARTITAGVRGLGQITGLLKTTTESVTTSVRSISNGIETIITKTADVTKTGGLVEGFQEVVNKTKAFAKNLIDLKKMGLNKNLFAQLVNAGADAGGATAQAIVDGGSETILALNDLYGQLDVAAADIAENTTDIMYEVGEQIISNGFIDGLVSQFDALTATAEAMANAFASAFNSQLAAAVQVALPAVPVAPVLPISPEDVAKNVQDQIADAVKETLPTVPVPDVPTAVMSRPDPKRSPQRYAAWLAGIGGIDPIRSPQRYAAQQKTYNITLQSGVITNAAAAGAEIVSAISAYERSSGAVYATA